MILQRENSPDTRLRAAAAKLLCALLLSGGFLLPQAAPTAGGWVHAYAAFGEPKYPRDFTHFDYVNPDAPKGGVIHLRNPDRRSSFDKFNTYTILGNAPAGMGIFMLETLTVQGADEPRTMYGLLAQEMRIEPDLSAITFRLDPRARFSNGDPVTAADVKYSFESLSGKYASPTYSSTLVGVREARVIDEHTIRFDLSDRSSDMLFKLGALPVFSHKWGLKPDGTHARFDEIVSEIPLASGPYTIDVTDSGRRIEFKRDREYWARDLPVRRGFFNFDRVVYRYYQDEAVATEAFKAGEFDVVKVYGAGTWMRQHRGAKWDDGRIAKKAFPVGTGQGLQSYQLNLRRPAPRPMPKSLIVKTNTRNTTASTKLSTVSMAFTASTTATTPTTSASLPARPPSLATRATPARRLASTTSGVCPLPSRCLAWARSSTWP